VICLGRSLAGVALALSLAAVTACTGEHSPGANRGEQSPASGSVAPTAAAPTVDEVARQLSDDLELFDGVVTGAIVLVRIGERTRVLASGLADVKHHRRMRPGDRFPIQSITKTMVATAVLQLVQEEVSPRLLPQGNRITIRNLLSHRAGLYDAADEDLPPLRDMTKDTLIDVAAAHPLEFAPGSSGRYSNVGYEVLGRVVERLTRMPLAAALEQNVFAPAGMSRTALLGSATVQGYFDSKAVEDAYLPFARAAGGVVSTVRDIDRFYSALWSGKLLDEELVETMTEPVGTVSPVGVDYGLGVWFSRQSCGTAMGHSGAGLGFHTRAWELRDAHRSAVVMVNDGDGIAIADTLAAHALCGPS
jgi:D-alanyl-D-alanine carboxypeptidase